jgi:hypothetical protein
MMTMTNKCVLLPVLCLLPLLIRCAVAPLAGGSDNPDFLVVGTVVDTSGQPARNAVVTIVPALYNPVTDPAPAHTGWRLHKKAGIACRRSIFSKGRGFLSPVLP